MNSNSAIKFKPILFSTEMVQAINAGRKTQTRRLLPDWCNAYSSVEMVRDPELCDPKAFERNEIKIKQCHGLYACLGKGEEHFKCKYDIGNILWVRETWQKVESYPEPDCFGKYLYKANGDTPDTWKPSIFMPKEACRLFLQVTDIWAERLQDITKEDAIAEGIAPLFSHEEIHGLNYHAELDLKPMPFKNYLYPKIEPYSGYDKAIDSYKSLWKKINSVESWNKNPFVWVITFKVVSRPEGFK